MNKSRKKKESTERIDIILSTLTSTIPLKDISKIEKSEDLINGFYTQLSKFNYFKEDFAVPDCFALRLSRFILSALDDGQFKPDKYGCFTDSFYEFCLGKIKSQKLATGIEDDELIVIYLKQCVCLLKSSSLLMMDAEFHKLEKINDNSLYTSLFNALWNKIPWDSIFPSDPEAAQELKANRNIFRDLLLNQKKDISLEKLANEFFELTGFTKKNDIVSISFIDFYLLTWLSHFGIIQYLPGTMTSPVRFRTTIFGEKIFSIIPTL